MNWYLTRIMAIFLIGVTIIGSIFLSFGVIKWCEQNEQKEIKKASHNISLEGVITKFGKEKYELFINNKPENLEDFDREYKTFILSDRSAIPDLDKVWNTLKIGMYLKINEIGLVKIAELIIIPPQNSSISNETISIWGDFETLNKDGVNEDIKNRLNIGICFSIIGIVCLNIIAIIIISIIAYIISDNKPEPKHCRECKQKIRNHTIYCSYCGSKI